MVQRLCDICGMPLDETPNGLCGKTFQIREKNWFFNYNWATVDLCDRCINVLIEKRLNAYDEVEDDK